SRPILSPVLDATNHRGSSTKLARGKTQEVRSLRSDRRPLRSQNVFLNFAGRSFRLLVDDCHAVRRLEVRELRARKLAQLALIRVRAFVEDNKGMRCFAPFFMWEPDDRHFLHG